MTIVERLEVKKLTEEAKKKHQNRARGNGYSGCEESQGI
jgi:hypothetical protein